jgi:hypothetical protein
LLLRDGTFGNSQRDTFAELVRVEHLLPAIVLGNYQIRLLYAFVGSKALMTAQTLPAAACRDQVAFALIHNLRIAVFAEWANHW